MPRLKRKPSQHLVSGRAETKLSELFNDALNALPLNQREGAAAFAGLKYCNKLFAWKERFKNLSPEERIKLRLKE